MSRQGFVWITALLLASSGCARWWPDRLDMTKLRDPRAADIDRRLSFSSEKEETWQKSPFESN